MNTTTTTQRANDPLKDHQISALVNELRDIAVQFHGAQQLRERIAQVVVPALRAQAAERAVPAAVPIEELLVWAVEDGVIRMSDVFKLDLQDAIEKFARRFAPPAQPAPEPACQTCNDHGAVGNILTAEPCPDCTPAAQPAPAQDGRGYEPMQGLAAYLRAEATGVSGVAAETLRIWASEVDAARAASPVAAAGGVPSDAMVDAYLQAQRKTCEEADRYWGGPSIGALHTNTVREACRAGLKAALAAAPQPPAPAAAESKAAGSGVSTLRWVDDDGNEHSHTIRLKRRRAASAPAATSFPMQPIELDEKGVVRFKRNRMVRDLLDFSQPRGFGMNEMAAGDYTADEWMQFAQLIGYSVSSYGDLSYASKESVARADAIAQALFVNGGAA